MSPQQRLNVLSQQIVSSGNDPAVKLGANHHGKGLIKVLKLNRGPHKHTVKQFTVTTILVGGCDASYLSADNRPIVATDTQKNTIYALARTSTFDTAEEFCLIVARHFVTTYPSIIEQVRVTVEEEEWTRLEGTDSSGQPSPHRHMFTKADPQKPFVEADVVRASGPDGEPVIKGFKSGLRKLTVLKTTKSSFEDFLRDGYTILPDTPDRMLSSAMDISWRWNTDFASRPQDWAALNATVKDTLLQTFAGPADTGVDSPSVQRTAYLMGQAVLLTVAGVDDVSIYAPNIHYLPYNLSALGLGIENKDHTGQVDVFHATTEPHGIIQVTVERSEAGKSSQRVATSSPSTAGLSVEKAKAGSGTSQITTHVLDTSMGRPGVGIRVRLEKPGVTDSLWTVMASGSTDADGRVAGLLEAGKVLTPGVYRMHFATGEYFAKKGIRGFYPEAYIVFEVTDGSHYHVPLLLNPFGYSTYRGS